MIHHSPYRDRKRKKFIGDGGSEKQKKIKTESGQYIKASYKSSAYQDWRDKHKIETPLMSLEIEDSTEGNNIMATMAGSAKFKGSKFKNGLSFPSRNKGGKGKSTTGVAGLKSKSEILKKRSIRQTQERRRRMKKKAAAMKGHSTKQRKGQTR